MTLGVSGSLMSPLGTLQDSYVSVVSVILGERKGQI
jgi:hypothetical protein